MAMSNLQDVLEHQIKDLYSAETQLTSAMPKMMEAATTQELKDAFQKHLEQTKEQVNRLQQAAEKLGIKPTGEKCHGMEGLIKEGQGLIQEHEKGVALDAALIAAAQRIEHYEIAGYGSACQFAEALGNREVKEILGQTLNEEEQTDKLLTQIAESTVNKQAMNA